MNFDGSRIVTDRVRRQPRVLRAAAALAAATIVAVCRDVGWRGGAGAWLASDLRIVSLLVALSLIGWTARVAWLLARASRVACRLPRAAAPVALTAAIARCGIESAVCVRTGCPIVF